MKSLKIPPIYGAIPILLAIPLIAMQFTEEVDWNVSDFLVMGAILLIALGLANWIWKNYGGSLKGVVFTVSLVLVFLFVWAELSVGLFGTPFGGD